MKRSVCIRLVALACSLSFLYASPVVAKRARMATKLLDALYVGRVTVDELVAATAASCNCAPARSRAMAAGIAEPSVEVGSATGAPGQQVQFSVILHTAGAAVAGVQDDIGFDSFNTPVGVNGSGRPDCTVNPAINKEATAFAFQPPGCVGAACTAFRALVLSFSNVDPIADGSVMYSCNVTISPGASPGTYPLVVSNVGMSTPDGQAIASTGTNGAIIVSGISSPTPTATPAGIGPPTSKDQCKKGGWKNFTIPRAFKNQGDCIQFVNTGK